MIVDVFSSLSLPAFTLILFLVSSCSTAPQSIEPLPAVVEVKKKKKSKSKKPKKKYESFTSEELGVWIDLDADSDQWIELSNEEGIRSYKIRETKGNSLTFRGETKVNQPITKVISVINNPKLRAEWIEGLDVHKTIEEKTPLDRIEYNRTKVPWPFEDRDFVYRVQVRVSSEPRRMLIAMKSLEDPRAPLVKGAVRGKIYYSYYYLVEDANKRSTRMVVEMSVDPMGAIPKWLAELSQKKFPHNTLKRLRALSMRQDLVVAKEVEDYFKRRGEKP